MSIDKPADYNSFLLFKTIKHVLSHVWNNRCYFANIRIYQSDHIVVSQNQRPAIRYSNYLFRLCLYSCKVFLSFLFYFLIFIPCINKKESPWTGNEIRTCPGKTGRLSILRTLSLQVLKLHYSYSFVLDSLLLLYISMFPNVIRFSVTKGCL